MLLDRWRRCGDKDARPDVDDASTWLWFLPSWTISKAQHTSVLKNYYRIALSECPIMLYLKSPVMTTMANAAMMTQPTRINISAPRNHISRIAGEHCLGPDWVGWNRDAPKSQTRIGGLGVPKASPFKLSDVHRVAARGWLGLRISAVDFINTFWLLIPNRGRSSNRRVAISICNYRVRVRH